MDHTKSVQREVARPPARELGTDEVLSQYGCRAEIDELDPPFHNRPRAWESHIGLSVIVGQLAPPAAAALVRTHKMCMPEDGVRYTTVGKLRDRGFVVLHTPTKRNRDHVTVSLPSEWGEDADNMFDSCFGEPIWADGGQR